MSIEPSDKAYAGQAIYNPATLALYDIVVLGISNRLIWRCPTRHILQLYNQHATGNHLDVGVGIGSPYWIITPAAAPPFASFKFPSILSRNPSSKAISGRRSGASHLP